MSAMYEDRFYQDAMGAGVGAAIFLILARHAETALARFELESDDHSMRSDRHQPGVTRTSLLIGIPFAIGVALQTVALGMADKEDVQVLFAIGSSLGLLLHIAHEAHERMFGGDAKSGGLLQQWGRPVLLVLLVAYLAIMGTAAGKLGESQTETLQDTAYFVTSAIVICDAGLAFVRYRRGLLWVILDYLLHTVEAVAVVLFAVVAAHKTEDTF